MSRGLRIAETGAVAAAGALQTLAYVHTAAWPLPILTLAFLAWRLDATAPRRAALLGWLYATAWLASGVWWLFISLHVYGALAAPLAAAAVLLLAATLALYLAAAAWAYARWRRGDGFDALLFAGLWLLTELARGVVFTGFPWLASGYAQVDSPLATLAPWLGVYGIGFVAAAMAAALARAASTRGRAGVLPLAGALALVALAALLPRDFTRPEGEIRVALIQTNVSQNEKFAPEHLGRVLAELGRELLAADADLVIAPETAIPLLPDQLAQAAPGYWDGLREHYAWPGRHALIGVPLGDHERGYTNSVIGLWYGPEYRYDKTHLVPFGEFIPPGFRWFTRALNIPLGDFARGEANPPSFRVGAQRVAPNVCYEDLFGEELARRFADPASAPTLLANVSNIAWFGDTIAIPQHLNISRVRALELQRPMVRATNTGATAVIDHGGRVTAALEPYTRGVLAARAEGRSGITPYVGWASRLGLWPLLLLALALVLPPALKRERRAPAAPLAGRLGDGAGGGAS
jgi:apolipoprotein N-acyltransferase